MRRYIALAAVCAGVLAGPGAALAGGSGRVIPEPQNAAGFITYPGFRSAMRTLAHRYPSRIHLIKVGHSAGGYPLYDVLVSDFSDHRPLSQRVGLYFNGSIHGDERDGAEGFA